MKFRTSQTVASIAALINCKYIGNPQQPVTGINEIHVVEPGDLVFVDHPKYYQKALNSAATIILINKEVNCPAGKALIISEKPFDDYNYLTIHFSPLKRQKMLINEASEIDGTAFIYPNVYIGNQVKIGKNVTIYPGACIMDRTIIDENVIVGPNTVIGHNAFYYKKKENGYNRMHTCGSVHVGRNVEIGASCTIDAGVSGTTVIGEGTKIDNQVHIGHDTVVGKNCLMAAKVGLAGCVRIEDHVILWGQVGCASDVTIGEGAIVLAQSGISKSLEGGKTYFGSPCSEVKEKFREMAALRKLPQLLDKLQ